MSYKILRAFSVKDINNKLVRFRNEDIGKSSNAVGGVVKALLDALIAKGYVEPIKDKKADE